MFGSRDIFSSITAVKFAVFCVFQEVVMRCYGRSSGTLYPALLRQVLCNSGCWGAVPGRHVLWLSPRHLGTAGEPHATPLPSQARVVICGGGIVGTSVAYHLAKLGWTEIVLLEQGRLAI